MNSRSGDYVNRINKVIDYIESNLNEQITLEDLADVANFSKYHFHRLFHAYIGETIYEFIQRVRIETAASRLLMNENIPVTDIAYDMGFSSVSVFSRSFKKIMSCTPSEWRENYSRKHSKICTRNSNIEQANDNPYSYFRNTLNLSIIRRMEMYEHSTVNLEIKDMPEFNVAYVRYIGPYKGDTQLFEGLYAKLFSWAGPRGLIRFPETKSICVYHDDPNITEEAKLRLSVCLTVPEDVKADGDVSIMKIKGGKYAVARLEVTSDEFGDAWKNTCGTLAANGYEPADGVCYEIYYNDHREHPEHKFIVDICIPVKA
jgi:AraC family transcriptional regulator